ncbi:MAG: hypothetical protein LQ348_000415 [Seirophora lacunosa]|nr:MAG: hypothetical protein LQ348_000415 [Seirophora lacunosa]
MDKFQAFGKNISSSFTPFAARTQQYVKEQFGQADEKTELPPDYIELEKRVDALKQVHQKLLSVTSQYSTEAYDYPPNIRESFNDLGRTITDKVNLLGKANSPADVQHALTAPPSAKPQPKTFNHAIARASLAGSQLLNETSTAGGEDPLATALEKYALAEEQVGEARLAQDAQIQSRFLSGWNTTLNTNLMFATRARRGVENARLTLDATKAKGKNGGARGMNPDDEMISEEARAAVEQKEDDFVAQTEEAVGVMKNVLDTPEPLRNLADLIAAQLEYHKKAYEILSELAPVVDGLQVEQEYTAFEAGKLDDYARSEARKQRLSNRSCATSHLLPVRRSRFNRLAQQSIVQEYDELKAQCFISKLTHVIRIRLASYGNGICTTTLGIVDEPQRRRDAMVPCHWLAVQERQEVVITKSNENISDEDSLYNSVLVIIHRSPSEARDLHICHPLFFRTSKHKHKPRAIWTVSSLSASVPPRTRPRLAPHVKLLLRVKLPWTVFLPPESSDPVCLTTRPAFKRNSILGSAIRIPSPPDEATIDVLFPSLLSQSKQQTTVSHPSASAAVAYLTIRHFLDISRCGRTEA